MPFILESFSGPAAGRKFDVPDNVAVTFGRNVKARYVIPDDTHLSGAHFSVQSRGQKCILRDLGSTNGTFVNGARITEMEIAVGMVVSAGSCAFKLVPGAPEEWVGYSPRHKNVVSKLFGYGLPVCAILDATREDRLPAFLQAYAVEHTLLYAGESGADRKAVALYLAMLPKSSTLWPMLMKEGWGKGWGVYFNSNADMATLTEHLRRMLTFRDDDGRLLYPQFYDPRVLRTFIPTFTAEESKTLFGPIARYVMEGEELDNPVQFVGAPPVTRTALDQSSLR